MSNLYDLFDGFDVKLFLRLVFLSKEVDFFGIVCQALSGFVYFRGVFGGSKRVLGFHSHRLVCFDGEIGGGASHRYKNPYCDPCVRAKMRHFKTHRGAFKRKLKQFGDLVTFDYMDVEKSIDYKFMTEKEILVIRDRFTGIIWAYPSVRKETEDVVNAFKHYMGRRKIREAYSDKARQFGPAMKELKIPLDYSLPGRPMKNSIAERDNQLSPISRPHVFSKQDYLHASGRQPSSVQII